MVFKSRFAVHIPFFKSGFIFVIFLLLLNTKVVAQEWPFELWHDGQIVLAEGDTLDGRVKYNLQQQFVQFSKDDVTSEALTPRKVLFFEIFDKTVNQYRRFFSIPYSPGGSYEAPHFFELLEEGKITLLSWEAVENRSVSMGYYGGYYNRLVLVNNYFILDEKGGIAPFSGKRHDLMQLMDNHSDNVEKYIRKNRLKIEEKYDLMKIVAYYNSLQRS